MMMINDLRGMRDLMDLAREIEACEGCPRRTALKLAIHSLAELTIMDVADVRYVPTGWTLQPHVSISIPPMNMRYADVIPHG
jgi:hypothetical protein